MPIVRGERPTVNTKSIEDEPASTHKVIFIRIPTTIAERFEHQKVRLSCTMNTLARMAIVKFLEEEESNERKLKGGR